MEKALSRVRPLTSLRLDPAFQKSDRRRLIFVQFERVPLFWRVDIDLFAASVDDPQYDIDNPRARGDPLLAYAQRPDEFSGGHQSAAPRR